MYYINQFMQISQNQPGSIQKFEHQPIDQVSPQDLTKDQLSENDSIRGLNKSSSNRCKKTFITFLALTIIAVLLLQVSSLNFVILQPKPDGGDGFQAIEKNKNFTFLVYCPYSNYENYKKNPIYFPNQQLRRLYSNNYPQYELDKDYSVDVNVQGISKNTNYFKENLYVVEIKHQFNDTISNNSILLYCGLTRGFYQQDCSNTVYRCSSPGPMFDLDAGQWTDIVWVNLLSNQNVVLPSNNCFNQNKPRCQLSSKKNSNQTYQDPTAPMPQDSSLLIKINKDHWPISTHVHGAEIRPTFDGNPLSWIDNTGKRGHGAMSLDDQCYYNQFTQFDSENASYLPSKVDVTYKQSKQLCSTYKINRYPNKQNPGNLWYHDHSMRLTNFNVQYGLSGLYILRNQTITSQLNSIVKNKIDEILIMMTVDGWQAQKQDGFVSDTYYRFRFLNNNFQGGQVFQISFEYGQNCNVADNKINFTIIAADSSIFSDPIYNQSSFIIAQAQRMEVLIKFQANKLSTTTCNQNNRQNCRPISICYKNYILNPIMPTQQQKIILKSANIQNNVHSSDQIMDMQTFSNRQDYAEGQQFILSTYIKQNTNQAEMADQEKIQKLLQELKLSVPYTNFSQKYVEVKRMRPLILYNTPFAFTINGRSDFHQGKSQNPVIGSYQDWYIINTMSTGHPIHVHLINFQVVQIYDLVAIQTKRKINCTLYQLDFYVETFRKNNNNTQSSSNFKKHYNNVFIKNENNQDIINYQYLCQNKSNITNDITNFIGQMVNKVNVQDQFQKINGFSVSGIYLLQQRNDIQKKSIQYAKKNRSAIFTRQQDQSMQYTLDSKAKPSPKIYYQRWKDTAFVQGFQASVFRMRWAKSSFNETDSKDTYFHVPADQLRQYPGFVYHCHILGHEDNQMMRPIMLQLPQQRSEYYLNTNLACNQNSDTSWAAKYSCLNEKCKVPAVDKTKSKNHY